MKPHGMEKGLFSIAAMVALTGCSVSTFPLSSSSSESQSARESEENVTSLSESPLSESGNEVSSSQSSHEEIVPAPEFEKIVDFANGGSNQFHFADGYTNGGPFNCYFRRAAGKIENGLLSLSVYKENSGTYAGAEYRSRANYSYGYFATRMKAANCSGVITSFFTYTHWPVWDEIDIEILGKNMRQVQFNYYTSGVGGHEFLYDLGFDASEDFHDYGFEWLPGSITWYIDGKAIYTATKDIPSNPQQIMMNVWNCHGYDSWSGVFDPSALPVTGQYEYIGYSQANNG